MLRDYDHVTRSQRKSVSNNLIGDVKVATDPVEGDRAGRTHHPGVELVEEVDLVAAADVGHVEGPVDVVLVLHLHPVDGLLAVKTDN